MTYSAFERIFAELIAAFPQRDIPTATTLIYWQDLAGMDAGLFQAAAAHCRRTCDWFPTIRQLREAAGEIAARAHGIPTPEQAWARILSIAGDWGDGRAVAPLLDATTFAALRESGGMRAVATADEVGLAQRRRAFLACYQPRYEARLDSARALPLPEPIARLSDGRTA